MAMISRFLWVIGLCLFLQNKAIVAQDRHAILVVSDHRQPFYLRTASKVYSSNSQGFLIIGGLTTGDFLFTVGFPKNRWSSMKYKIEIEQDDLYLLLKKIDSLTWGLYNKNGMQVYIAEATATAQRIDQLYANDDFSKTLAEVSDNPSLLNQTVKDSIITSTSKENNNVATIPKKQMESSAVVEGTKKEQDNELESINGSTVVDTLLTNQKENVLGSAIRRTGYQLDSTGISMMFELKEKDKTDEVIIFIPNEKSNNLKEIEVAVGKKKKRKNKEEKQIQTREKEEEGLLLKTAKTKEQVTLELSTLQDFKVLRRQLTAVDEEVNMIGIADSLMNQSRKSYPVDQIKNLGLLFLQDSLRLNFIEKALKYVAFGEQLATLETLFLNKEQVVELRRLIEQKR
jgi:hypothetical protein